MMAGRRRGTGILYVLVKLFTQKTEGANVVEGHAPPPQRFWEVIAALENEHLVYMFTANEAKISENAYLMADASSCTPSPTAPKFCEDIYT